MIENQGEEGGFSGMVQPTKTHEVISMQGRLIYGVLDLLFATLYAYVFLMLVPSRSVAITMAALFFTGIMAAGGVGMLVRAPWGRKVAVISSILMLAVCLTLILLLAASAAYLHGIYDGIGQAGVAISIIVAALTLEAVGLLPLLQLIHIRRLKRQGEGSQ